MAIETAMGLMPAVRAPEPEKTPSTRLLDMLAGWSRYAQHDAENGVSDDPRMETLIEDLYQRAAVHPFGNDAAWDNGTEKAMEEFLTTHVLPVLMRKTAETRG